MARKRVFFVINSLEGGGAERVFSTVLSRLHGTMAGADLELVLLDRLEEKYEVPAGITRHVLDCGMSVRRSFVGLSQMVRRDRPDLLFSFLSRANCACVIAGRLFGIPSVISERVHTTSHFATGPTALVNKLAVRALYRHASRVVAVSEGVADDLARSFGVSQAKIETIYNPVERDDILAKGALEPQLAIGGPYLVAVGRLVPNKNFQLLLKAFAASGVDSRLVILGEGPERESLQALANRLGIGGRVHLPGHVDNPFAIVKRAHAFVSSSNAEGFPNAMVEAMSLGVPVVVTDCDSGPAEILAGRLQDKVGALRREAFGILVPVESVAEMAKGIRLIHEPTCRAQYGVQAERRSRDFDPAATVARYEATLAAFL
jgi:N-acetylgalactosamine-N,N'-diacetylbacillosaminyl-diphospho-undecaprenol 4-alpha-N-acetylgalactosaminyltransferase